MIAFWVAAALLVAAVLAVLLRPLLRRPPGAGAGGGAVAVFRRQLAELDADAAQGRLVPEAAEAARAEIARRALAAADRDAAGATLATGPKELTWRIGAAIGIAGVLPAAAIIVYLMVGAPYAIGGRAGVDVALRAHETAELAAAADTLAARVKADPGNLEDWIMLGRTAVALQRFTEAGQAYRHAIVLAPDRTGLHAELGEVLVLAADGVVTSAAVAEFGKAGTDPRARYYLAEAALQHGETEKGAALLRALLADAPGDAPWRPFVAARLAQIAPGGAAAQATGPAAATTAGGGPTAADIAAARTMSPQTRAAMIRGMVARLAARLDQHPDDPAGWARLAHAYDVLGETDKAAEAQRRAAAAQRAATPAAAPH